MKHTVFINATTNQLTISGLLTKPTPTKKPNPITPVGLFALGVKLAVMVGVKRRRQALQVGVANVPLTDLNLLKQ